jgi:hypothetical protein
VIYNFEGLSRQGQAKSDPVPSFAHSDDLAVVPFDYDCKHFFAVSDLGFFDEFRGKPWADEFVS